MPRIPVGRHSTPAASFRISGCHGRQIAADCLPPFLSGGGSCQFIGLEFLPGTVADVEHVDLLLLLHDAVDYAVHVRLVAKEQVSEVTVFWRHRAAVGAASQGANGVPEAAISGKSRIGRASCRE